MKIIVTPQDLIERCLWSDYEQYAIRHLSTEQRNTIIRENKEFEINERDAFVCRLLRCIYTDNLVHKLNEFLMNILDLKSIQEPSDWTTYKNEAGDEEGYFASRKHLINKETLLSSIDRFRKFFPAAYEPDLVWAKALAELEEYAVGLKGRVELLPTTLVQDEWVCVSLVSFKKLLAKHHG